MAEYRNSRIHDLFQMTTYLILTPELKQGARVAKVMQSELESVTSLVKEVSSSSPGYAEKDLPIGLREELATARHNVTILHLLYGVTESCVRG